MRKKDPLWADEIAERVLSILKAHGLGVYRIADVEARRK